MPSFLQVTDEELVQLQLLRLAADGDSWTSQSKEEKDSLNSKEQLDSFVVEIPEVEPHAPTPTTLLLLPRGKTLRLRFSTKPPTPSASGPNQPSNQPSKLQKVSTVGALSNKPLAPSTSGPNHLPIQSSKLQKVSTVAALSQLPSHLKRNLRVRHPISKTKANDKENIVTRQTSFQRRHHQPRKKRALRCQRNPTRSQR
jgi:hypothetical protein